MKLVIDNKSRIGWVLGRIKNAILGRVKREKKKYYPFSRTIMNQHIEHFIKTNKEYLELFPYSAKGVDSYEKWEGITQTRNDTTFPLHCWGFAQKI